MRGVRAWLLAPALVAPLLLGARCDLPPIADPGTSTSLELVTAYTISGGYFLHIALSVDTDQSFQAVDVKIEWQGDSLALRPVSDEDFDDDGQVLGGPLPWLVSETPFRISDLRHGDAAVTGNVGLYALWLIVPNGGDAELSAEVTLARPDGSVVQAGSDTLTFSESQLP